MGNIPGSAAVIKRLQRNSEFAVGEITYVCAEVPQDNELLEIPSVSWLPLLQFPLFGGASTDKKIFPEQLFQGYFNEKNKIY